MALVTPVDDFAATLDAVVGLMAKLRYIVELRDLGGSYDHWGLSQRHGATVMGRVIRLAHTDVLNVLLRAHVGKVLDDLRRCAAAEGVSVDEYLIYFEEMTQSCVPPNSAPVLLAHFESLLFTLRSLIRASRH